MLGLAVILSSCNVNELHEQELPEGEYVRLNLSTGDDTASPAQTRAIWEDPNGKGNLGFRWEAVAIDSDETNKLSIILSNGTKALNNQATPAKGALEGQLTYTGAAVTPNQSNAHLAGFETVRYYSTEDLNTAKYVYAVAGGASITADEESNQHICRLEMPSTFAQVENQDPSFLRDYMYMYAATAYNVGSSTRLKFNHIPATFRFIFNNTKDDMSFESVTVSVVEGGAVASKATDVTFDWTSKEAKLSFSTEGYESLTTTLSSANVQNGAVYTAYSMALPLASNDAFKGKTVIFTAKGKNGVNLSYLLDGEKLAQANGNGSGIYNWVGGKSYTIKFNIGEGGKTTGVMLSNKDITVASTVGGTFTLKYVDASGVPLANYYADICTLNLAEMALYDDFIDANMVPATAAAIGIYDEAVKVGSIDINGFKADNSGLLYSVGMLSDVHINTENSDYGTDADKDFENALTFFNSTDVNVAFTCTCGDITEHGTEAELAKYKEIVAKSTTSVYTTTGNHDCVKDADAINETLWKQYTDNGLTYEVSKTVNGKTDHYLFLGMSTWKDNMPNPYNTSNLLWLRSKLETYRNERCFVITHLFFPEESGNLLGIYPEGNWLKGSQLNELKEMRGRYKNSIWFSGHSHWKWSLQQFEDIANIYKKPSAGWSVHIPSCAKPSDSDGIPGSSSARQEKVGLSEGAVINVYENHIDVLGVDFTTGKYLPIATYRLDTTLQPVEEIPVDDTYLKAEDFEAYKGTGMSITDVPGMPGYIDVIFTEKEQGYYVKNSTFTNGFDSSNQIFDLDIEYLQCWTDWGESTQAEVTTIENVGFYSGDYNLVSTELCYVNSVRGVQFQTKSDCAAAFPIKIRMKARGRFSLKDPNKPSYGTHLSAANFKSYKGTGMSISDVPEMPGYIDVIFTDNKQGFYMTNSTFTYGYDNHYQTVDISIDDLQCWTGWGKSTQAEVDTIEKVGFYSGNYNLKSTSSCYVNAQYGVQFQTSSSCTGPFPIKIRMKASAYFNLKSNAPSRYLSAANFAQNPDMGTATVSDVEGMPGYVDVTFTGTGQGFFVTNYSHSSKTENMEVVIEDLKAMDENGTEINVPAMAGFNGYLVGQESTSYKMDEEMTFMNISANGIEFQTSPQCPGPWPFTLRMKATAFFY